MAVVISTGEGFHVVAKHTFWDLEDDEAEEIVVQRPRAFTDSSLFRSVYINDANDDDEGTLVCNENLSSVETDAGSSEGDIRSRPSSPLWSASSDEEDTPTDAPPPGTFYCQMPSLQWVPVAVMGQVPGKSRFA